MLTTDAFGGTFNVSGCGRKLINGIGRGSRLSVLRVGFDGRLISVPLVQPSHECSVFMQGRLNCRDGVTEIARDRNGGLFIAPFMPAI